MKKSNFSIQTIATIVFALTFSNIVFCQKTNNFNLEGKSVSVFTTAYKTDFRISAMGKIPFANFTPLVEKEISVFVDPSKNYQTMLGIGGALTDAAAEVFAKLPKAKQDELIQAYYNSESGIGYTLARTNIASCDFSSSSYNYVTEKDSLLKSFSVAHDLEFRIPLIKKSECCDG
jgi:glucosylceramidase